MQSYYPFVLSIFFVSILSIFQLSDYFYRHSYSSTDLEKHISDSKMENVDGDRTSQCNTFNYKNIKIEIDNSRIYDDKSLLIDLYCESAVSTIDILWKDVDKTRYNYTIQTLSKNESLIKEFNYLSNLLPINTSQTTGMENVIGRYINVSINSPKDINSSQGISSLVINLSPQIKKFNDIKQGLWERTSSDYPKFILIGSSGQNLEKAELYRITDGDDLDIINPFLSIYNSSIFELKNKIPFFISIDAYHIEGIDVNLNFESDHLPIILVPLNDTSEVYENAKIKTFNFVPNLSKVYDCKNSNSGYMTIMFAVSSETSLYYKIPVGADFSVCELT